MDPFKSAWERPDPEQRIRAPIKEKNERGKICFDPIGYITSPFEDFRQIPMIPLALNDTEGKIEILPQYAEGIEKLESFSHIYVLYHLHRPAPTQMKVKPPFQTEEYGVFATRFPCRPNGIAISLLQLVRIEGSVLHVKGIDMLNGEAVLDIRPYIEDFDKLT